MENNTINNRYQISCKLGEGGMGTVYLANDILKANTKIAVKTIKEKALAKKGNNSLELFKQEYEVMTRLSHPNLVKVYDFGRDDLSGDYYIAMEYVQGQTIREILKKQIFLSENLSLEIFVSLLRAMEFIHSRGILYRDIKPENILVDLEEADTLSLKSVKLLDFGLADIGCNTKDIVKGTVYYMAPEVLKGRVDRLSDIFGLGVLFYELYSGSQIYTDSNFSSVISSLSNATYFKQSISLSLDNIKNCNIRNIIQKMTEYIPEKRFKSCSEIIQTINQLTGRSFEIETKETKDAYVFGVNFVARNQELVNLQNFLNIQECNQLYLLTGSLGIGKTRIFEEFKKDCRLKSILYYQGKCNYAIPFEPFIAILTETLLNCNETLILKYGAELKKLLPEHSKLAAIQTAITQDPKTERGLLVEIVSNFLIEFAFIKKQELQTEKTVLFIDNLQWADELSLDVISELLYKISVNHLELQPSHNLRIFTASRDDEHENIEQFLKTMQEKNRITRDVLQPFNDAEVTEYIKAIFGENNLHRSLLENIPKIKTRAGGNPVFLQELVKTLVESNMIIKVKSEWALVKSVDSMDIPRNLQEIISQKIKALVLDEDERVALDLLALLTKTSITMDFFIKLAQGFIQVNVKKLFDYLALKEIHSFSNSEYHSANNLISEVLKKEMPTEYKQRLHQHIASRMEILYKADKLDIKHIRNDYLEDLAYHFANIGTADEETFISKIARYIEEAADRFVLKYANKKAISYYELILRLVNRLPYKNQSTVIKKQVEILLKHGSVLQFTGKSDEALASYHKALDLVIAAKDQRLIASCNLKIGAVLTHKSRYEEAEICFVKSLAFYRRLNDKAGISEVLFNQGVIQKNYGNYSESLNLNQEALSYLDSNTDESKIANIYGIIGTVYLYQSEFDKAMNFYEMQLMLYKHLDNKSEIARTIGNIGIIYFQQGNYEKARDCYEKRIKTAEEIGDKMGATLATSNLASIYFEQKMFDKALSSFEKSLKAFEELDAKSECIRMAINIGSIYLSQNKYDKALAIYKSNLANAEKIGDKRLMSACVSHIGDVYSTAGYYEKAMKFYSRDLEIKESLGDKSGISILYGNMCIILYEQGKFLEALEAVEKAIAIDTELNTKVHLMYHLANKAEVMYYLGEYKDADKFNKESMKLNQDFEDEGFLYEATLLACKIDFQTGDDDKKYNQIRRLNRMLADSTDNIHIAELNYQIYKLLKASPLVEIKDADKYREKAISLFKTLNQDNETAKYKKIIAELEVG